MTLGRSYVNLLRAANSRCWVGHHFSPVRNPARQATDCKQRREHLWREAHRFINNTGVEVHVWIELALNKVLVSQCGSFELFCDFQQRIADA